MGYFTGKKILIIGGTGTIGQGISKEIMKQNPSVVRIFSRDEYKQFLMQNKVERNISEKFRFLIGDIRDYDRVERAMSGIDVVFNFAAMKHVPACEYNPSEAIKTNVNGMENVIKAAIYNNVESVVFTSSDKAINPTNSYGATKLLAEKLVQAANYSKGPIRTKFSAVRFGNVMGSRGSAIPFFKEQLLDNGRVTVTDLRMTRFMMTLSEAVKLTLTVSEKCVGGEVFVLKMPVMKLQHIVEVVIEETCKKYGLEKSKIKTEKIGLRAGERLFEELMTKEESEYAYDLGDMFAVLPTNFILGGYDKYINMKRACQESYNSSCINPISKEELRKIILSEGLI